MKNINLSFSDYGRKSLVTSPVNRMLAEITHDFRPGIDINLGVGYVDENAIPRDYIWEAVEEISKNSERLPSYFNYGCSQGSPNLITALKEFYSKHMPVTFPDTTWKDFDIVIGSNGITSILEGFAEIFFRKNSVIIMTDPWYYIYSEFLIRKGYSIITIPEDMHGMRADMLEKELNRISFEKFGAAYVYVPTVSNPTSTILSNERRKHIVDIINESYEKSGTPVPVIFDNAYEFLLHGDCKKMDYFLKDDKYGLVYNTGSLSKIIAPGLRIGYLIGKKNDVLKALTQKVCDSGFSAGTINQEIAAHLIKNHIENIHEAVLKIHRDKAAEIKKFICENLEPLGVTYTGGQAGFYFYFTLPEKIHKGTSTFFKYISRNTGLKEIDRGFDGELNPRLAVIPGEMCVNPKGPLNEIGKRQFRISYAYESIENILRGLEIIRDAIKYAEK